MENQFGFEIKKQGSKGYFNPRVDLTATTVGSMRDAVKGMISSGVTELEFDMKDVEIVDSSGIGFLVAVYNSLSKFRGKLIIKNISERNLELFKALRLDKYFLIQGN
ncbi:MAG: STAS domain-containing protein [Syntrophobacterales bacterium]|nr:STAS domain-containing protein [Syntrophobacterales bacterium]